MIRPLRAALAVALCLGASPALATGWATAPAGPLRTAYTRINAVIDGDTARTTVTQVFVNDLETPVEVTYRFPLPEDASVTGFADWRDGRRLEATVAGKEDAREAYEEAAAEGRPAAMAEKEADARFVMRLSTVPPRGARRVELTYVQTLSALGGERTWVFPAERKSDVPPPTVLDVDVTLRNEAPIRAVQSLNHGDARIVSRRGDRHVALSRTGGGLGYDLALRWRVETEAIDLAARAVRPDAAQPGYVEARLSFASDPYQALRPPQDVVILLDRSLSMAGEPLERGRALVEGVLAELAPEDRFSLLTFNDKVTPIVGELATADDANIDLAQYGLDDVRASGRSNLQSAIDVAASLLRDSRGGTLVLVTDGQPTAGAGYTRVPLAADRRDWVDHRVVVAHASYPSRQPVLEQLFPQVTVRYVPDGDAGVDAIESLIRLVVAPIIEDLRVDIDGANVFALEGKVPARLAVGEYVRLLARAESDVVVSVTGTLHGRPIALERRVALPDGPDDRGDRGLPVEWARLRVAGLEVRFDGAEHAEQQAIEAEIRSLGAAYRLATRFTSYVLTDSLAPDRIMPGDPEIRVHAPKTALGVRAILPWGEVVDCHWQEDEELWLGRFLVPRGTADGMYRMRVFVDSQEGTALRGTLFFRVDSKPPEFELLIEGDATVTMGDTLRVIARPKDHVYEGKALRTVGDTVVRDKVDLKRIVVQLGDREYPLEQVGDGEVWAADLPVAVLAGRHVLKLVAVDYALNSTEATLAIDVTPEMTK
ncbi:MAG: VWA domain-containing protein [Deltaproteobacteria bacterium]|nr:MAG: VWA domain-containing protein [Deltaproteobacteria bacterium]